jgi:hypothetical protein
MLAATPEWQRLFVLAPVFVVGAGLIAAVLILLARAFADSVRDSEHKRLILVGAIVLVGVVMILTYLGVSLPKEE